MITRLSLVQSIVGAVILCVVVPAHSQAPALSFSSDGGYTNGFTGTLGWEFTVNTTVSLTDFGFYNNGGTIDVSHQLGLWDTSGNLLASGSVDPSSSDNTIGYFDYSAATPYPLQAGESFVIGTLLTSGDYFYYDPSNVTTDPSITYVQTQFDTNDKPSLTFPQTTDFPANGYGYFGPSFEVGPAPSVPEPNALLVTLLGVATICGLIWRLKARPQFSSVSQSHHF